VKDLKPGDKLSVEVEVENNADRDSRVDFRSGNWMFKVTVEVMLT